MRDWLSKRLVGVYRLFVGDVQISKMYTGFNAYDTVFLGLSDHVSRKVHVEVRQLKYIKIYSRWWLRERFAYGYEVRYAVFDGLAVVDSGIECFPQLCSKAFVETHRPHLLAIDCFMSGYIHRTSRSS